MATDIFEFMLGKKEKKTPIKRNDEEKQNYAFLMPVEVYTDEDEKPLKDTQKYDPPYTDGNGISSRDNIPYYDIEKLDEQEQLMSLKRTTIELEDTVSKLKKTVSDLHNKNSELLVQKSRQEYVVNNYRILLEKIVKVMPYYLEIEFTGIGSPESWADRELVEMFAKCCEDILKKQLSLSKELEKLKKNPPIQTNQKQSSTSESIDFDDIPMELLNDDLDIESNDDIESSIPGDITDELDDVFNTDIQDEELNPFEEEKLVAYKSKLQDTQMRVIFETIGQTGLTRVVDLKEIAEFNNSFISNNGEFNQGIVSKKIQELVSLDLLEIESINTGRKGGLENLHSLTSLGRSLYKSMFRSEPKISEKEVIRKQHTSLEHGYFIKAVAKELENKGYDVFDAPEDCIRRPLKVDENGDSNFRVEADLIAKKDDEELIIECEMGTTSQADMNKKLDKLILVTTEIHFIMNKNESLSQTANKVDRWISKKGKNNLKGYTFKFTTLDNLKRRPGCQWQNKSF